MPIRKFQWRYPFQNLTLCIVGLLCEDWVVVDSVDMIVGDSVDMVVGVGIINGITTVRVIIPVGNARVNCRQVHGPAGMVKSDPRRRRSMG